MKTPPPQSGFSLVELSMVLAVVGVMVGMSMMVGGERIKVQEIQTSWNELQTIKNALNFFAVQYGRMPCPARLNLAKTDPEYGREASDCSDATPPAGLLRVEYPAASGTYIRMGTIPYKVLQLSDAFIADEWENRYLYAVSENTITAIDSTVDGIIRVEDGSGNLIIDKGVYVLATHGITGKGGTNNRSLTVQTACDVTNLDKENCDSDGVFVDERYYDGDIAANFFDDYMLWSTRMGILAVAAKKAPPAAPPPPASAGLISAANYGYVSCGIAADGKAYCWGWGIYGQLGNNFIVDQWTPVAVLAGASPGTFTHVRAGRIHTCGLGVDNKAYCWGFNSNGQLGNNSTTSQLTPVAVLAGASPGAFTQISIGGDHNCGIGNDSKAYCWGQGTNGKLGNNSTTSQLTPVAVLAGASPGTFTQISASGKNHTCAIGTDSKAYCWGEGANGKLGNNSTAVQWTPVAVLAGESPGTFTQIAAGLNHTCAIGTDSKAYCWGFGVSILGNGFMTTQLTPVAVLAGASPGTFTQISVGNNHSCGLGTDGKAYCWGWGSQGVLGNNSTTLQLTPVLVLAGAGPGAFTEISAGYNNTCAIGTDSKAYCWGFNSNGQLGINSTVQQSTPVAVHVGAGYIP